MKAELDKLDYPRKENLYTIIDLIQRKEIYFKSDLQKYYGFTAISLAEFKELIPTSTYLNEDIQFLIDNNFILRNEFYKMGYKSKSYKIPVNYMGTTIGVMIENKNINKRIDKQIKKYRAIKVKNLELAKTEYFKNFKIDYEGAQQAIYQQAKTEIIKLLAELPMLLFQQSKIDELVDEIICCKQSSANIRQKILDSRKGKDFLDILHRYMIYSSRINAINDGFLFFKRNKTNNRLDSNLTSLPSFLRPFLLAEEPLMHIDIKNSQPYFLYVLLQNESQIDKQELNRYKELVVTGKLYEYLLKEFNYRLYKKWNRDNIKKMLFRIFYSKNKSYLIYKETFKSLFPTIMEYINQTNSIEHNTLSLKLQNLESYSVLDVLMPLFESQGIRPFTIHDSFVCKQSEKDVVIRLTERKLKEMYGFAPSLHVNTLIDNATNDGAEFIDDEFDEVEENKEAESIEYTRPVQLTTYTKEEIEELLNSIRIRA
jgi:hypothetical protein